MSTAPKVTPELARQASQVAPQAPPHQYGIISRDEYKFLAAFALLLCAVTTVPYAYGYLVSVPGTQFTGLMERSYDSNNYLAYIHQAASGKWLFRNPMTPEPHRAVFFNLEWLAIGKVASVLHLSLTTANSLARLFCLVLMCWGVYWLASFLFSDVLMRRIALIATMAGGGFGWIVAVHLLHVRLDSSNFLDLMIPFFPFYWALKVPHFLVSQSFVVLSMGFFLCAEGSKSRSHYVAAGLCSIVAGACRPYDMLFLMAAMTLFIAGSYLSNGEPRATTVITRTVPVWICIPLLGYYVWIFKIHPVFRYWSLPGAAPPSAWLFCVTYGMAFLLLPFAVWGLIRHGLGKAGLFLVISLITAIVLCEMHRLFHFSFQFGTNIPVPLILIVLLGLKTTILRWNDVGKWGTASIVGLLLVNSFTSIALAGQDVVLIRRGEYRADIQMLNAYSWLNDHTQANDVILADFDHSNELPHVVQSKVYCGYINAVNLDGKIWAVNQFMDPKTPAVFRQKLLSENSIAFVLLTPQQAQELGAFTESSLIKEVFRNNAAVIFAVNKSAGAWISK